MAGGQLRSPLGELSPQRLRRAGTRYVMHKRIRDKDRRRAVYHQFCTNRKWGHSQNYHITLDSGVLGLETCTEIIRSLY